MNDPAEHPWARVVGLARQLAGAKEQADPALFAVYHGQLRDFCFELARRGEECAMAWETLAFWTEEPAPRLQYYESALRQARNLALPVDTSLPEILCEIGRTQVRQGEKELARRYFTQAREEALRQQESWPARHSKDLMNSLLACEGEASALLLQLEPQDGA